MVTTKAHSHSRTGRPSGGGGQATVLLAEELDPVEKCLVGTRTEHRDRALLLLQYATGMRAGELAALDVADVLPNGRVRNEFRLGTDDTKYCRARTIYLENAKASRALLTYLRARNPALTFTGAEPLFVGPQRNHRDGTRRLSPNSIVQAFARMYDRAGNVGAILGACLEATRAAGWTNEQITAVLDHARAGDYDHLRRVVMQEPDVLRSESGSGSLSESRVPP